MKSAFFKNVCIGILVSASLVSCKKNNPTPNSNVKYSIPTDYTFVDGSNKLTIDIKGQKYRIAMIDQISSEMTDSIADNQDNLFKMLNGTMFNNNADSLNNSSFNLIDKTANVDFFKSVFEMSAKATSSKLKASEGVAGYYNDNGKKRYFNENGLEPSQLFKKGIMGACLMNQVLNYHLNTSYLDAGTNKTDNNNRVVVSGENYTTMEHLWDEAYGYIFGGDINDHVSPEYNYWSEYIHIVNTDIYFNTIKKDIIDAFIKGRAAITNKDYTTRDAQIAIIQKSLSKVSAVRGVFYLTNEGKSALSVDGGIGAFHPLSEGYGFIWSLKYSYNPETKSPYFSENEIDVILADLMKGKNGFYDVDYLNANLNTIAEKIATRFGFTVEQAFINVD